MNDKAETTANAVVVGALVRISRMRTDDGHTGHRAVETAAAALTDHRVRPLLLLHDSNEVLRVALKQIEEGVYEYPPDYGCMCGGECRDVAAGALAATDTEPEATPAPASSASPVVSGEETP